MRLVNFRDLGGLPLSSGGEFPDGRLYRSGTFQFLTEAETAQLASNLGLVTVIDLRAPSEPAHTRRRFPDGVEVLEIPFLTNIEPEWERPSDQSPRAVAGRYLDMLEQQGVAVLTGILRAIRADRFPLVIHCSAGKDRTGILIALLLTLAGVTEEAIAADYAASGPTLTSLATNPTTAKAFQPNPPNEYETDPETMRLFLHAVTARHGSIEGLAIGSNVDMELLQQAKAALLERR